jgi:hypothetical protein
MADVDNRQGIDHRKYEKFKKDQSARYYIRCLEMQQNGESLTHCTYIERFDWHTKNSPHECYFLQPLRQTSIVQYEQPKDKTFTKLEQILAEFIGSENLPLDICCSQHLFNMLRQLYVICKSSVKENPNVISVKNYLKGDFQRVNPKRIRECIVHIASIKKRKGIEIFRSKRLNAISVDGVTIHDRKFLNFDLVNTTFAQKPISIAIRSINDATTSTFVETFNGVFPELYEQGIEVATVISDGYPPQIAAFDFRNQISIQSIFSERFSKIILVPCIAHKLNNVIKFVYRDCPEFAEIINSARYLAVELRRGSFRGRNSKKCPSYIQTRWRYDADIIAYLVDHEDSIRQWIQDSDSEANYPVNLLIVADILTEMKFAITTVESESLSVTEAYPKIERLQNQFKRWRDIAETELIQ